MYCKLHLCAANVAVHVVSSLPFTHSCRYYSYLMNTTLLRPPSLLTAHQPTHTTCCAFVLNMLVADITRRAPLKVTSHWLAQPKREEADSTHWLRMLTDYKFCFDEASSIMGYCPLQHSHIRADTVLK